MSYVAPDTVVAPKSMVSDVHVIYDAGQCENSWAVATFRWLDRPAVSIRWNGDPGDRSIGTPQARGIPTWFVVPEPLEDAVLQVAYALASGTDAKLVSGYSEMASDHEREREAQEWSEGLIGDGTAQR